MLACDRGGHWLGELYHIQKNFLSYLGEGWINILAHVRIVLRFAFINREKENCVATDVRKELRKLPVSRGSSLLKQSAYNKHPCSGARIVGRKPRRLIMIYFYVQKNKNKVLCTFCCRSSFSHKEHVIDSFSSYLYFVSHSYVKSVYSCC